MKAMIKKLVKRLLTRSQGFTIVEVVVATGLLSVTLGLIGTTVFQSLSIERFWRDGAVATKSLRHATSQFSRDALVAQTVDLNCPSQPSCVILSWTDSNDVPHTATYSLVDNPTDQFCSTQWLVRDLDGAQTTVACGAVSTAFSLSGNVLDFDLEVEGDLGTTKSISLQTYLRLLQP